MSHSLDILERAKQGAVQRNIIGLLNRDARSVDYSSYSTHPNPKCWILPTRDLVCWGRSVGYALQTGGPQGEGSKILCMTLYPGRRSYSVSE